MLTPINVQYKNNINFKGASSLDKYEESIKQTIKTMIDKSFENVFSKAGKETDSGVSKKVLEFINNSAFLKRTFNWISDKRKEINNVRFIKQVKQWKSNADDKITDGIAYIIGSLSNSETSKKLVSRLGNFKKPSARMADLASFAITFFYVNNTRKSEKIEEERKMPLMVNNIAVTVVSSTMAALIDKGSDVILDRVKAALCLKKGKQVLDGVINNTPDILNRLNGGSIEDLAEDIMRSKEFRMKIKDYTKRFEKAKSLTVFSITVRFLVTVLMVPVAGKIVKIIKEKMVKDKNQATQNK